MDPIQKAQQLLQVLNCLNFFKLYIVLKISKFVDFGVFEEVD